MAFRFRLERVLKIRQRVLEQCTREVAAADVEWRRRAAREAELAGQDAQLCRSAIDGAGRILDVRDLSERAWRLRRLRELRVEAARDAELARLELERRRARLTDAWRDVEVLRKLESRRREQWEQEQRRREGRELDEIGGIRADRLRRSRVSA